MPADPPEPHGHRPADPPEPDDVLVVGSANADLVVHVERRPGAGETVLGGDLLVLPGGKGANQAVAAARLGARTAFVGRVGDDPHGRLLRESLAAAGVRLEGLRRSSSPTGVAMILLTPDGDNSIVVAPGANADVRPADAQHDAVARARVLVVQREVAPGVSLAAAQRAGGLVVLNLAPSGPVPAALLDRTDVLVVNEHEALDLLHALRPGAAARTTPGPDLAGELRALGPAAVVITLGARGAVAVDATGSCTAPAPPVAAVDTTGAGDAFTGALAWRLARGDALGSALRWAVRAGTAAVLRPGAQPSFPTVADLDRLGDPGPAAGQRGEGLAE